MEHDVRAEGAATVITFSGEVDLENSPRAREILLGQVAQDRKVLVDLGGVEYIDSSGIASLVEAFQEARRRGTSFGLVCVSPPALRVLKLARLDRVFTIFDSLQAGLDGDC